MPDSLGDLTLLRRMNGSQGSWLEPQPFLVPFFAFSPSTPPVNSTTSSQTQLLTS